MTWFLFPFIEERTGCSDFDSGISRFAKRFIREAIYPALIPVSFGKTVVPADMQNHGRMLSGQEHCLSDSFPAFNVGVCIATADFNQPGHGAAAPARERMAEEQNQLLLGNLARQVQLPIR